MRFQEDIAQHKAQTKPCYVSENEQLRESIISDLYLLQDVLVFGTKEQQIKGTITGIQKLRQYQKAILNY